MLLDLRLQLYGRVFNSRVRQDMIFVGYCMVGYCRILHDYHFSWVLYVWVGMVTLGWLEGTFTFLCESRFALKPLITAEKAF